MPSDPVDDDVLRDRNARIASDYDRMPYDEPASPSLDPGHIFALAARYGHARNHRDVDILDLGCGTGAQLERAAGLTTGNVVGTDISQAACETAQARTARFGSRCRIVHADALDLAADDLGRFDLIYHIGVIYVTPPAVQRHLLGLIADCLKPGGVALISYCVGTVPLLMAGLHRVLRARVDSTASPQEQVRVAREQIKTIANTVARQSGDQRLIGGVLQQVYRTPDTVFFHEMLSGSFGPLTTSELERALGERGVHFLNWMQPAPFDPREVARIIAGVEDMVR